MIPVLLFALAAPQLPTHLPHQESAAAEASPLLKEADRLSAECQGLLEAGSNEEALEASLRALALRREELGPDDPRVAMSLNTLGYVYSRIGQHAEAVASCRSALELMERDDSAPGVETVARIRRNLAEVHANSGDFAAAFHEAKLASECMRRVHGIHPIAAEMHEMAGSLALHLDLVPEALQQFEAALACNERTLSAGHERSLEDMLMISSVLLRQGRPDAALWLLDHIAGGEGELAARAIALGSTALSSLGEIALSADWQRRLAAGYGLDDPSAGAIRSRFAEYLLESGLPEEALSLLEGSAPDSMPPGLIDALCAQSLAQAGQWEEALAAADRALGQDALPPESGDVLARTLLARSRAYHALGQSDLAQADLLKSVGLRVAGLGPMHPVLVENYLVGLALIDQFGVKSAETTDLLESSELLLDRMSAGRIAAHKQVARLGQLAEFTGAWKRAHLVRAEEDSALLPATFAALERERSRSLLTADAWWAIGGEGHRISEAASAAFSPTLQPWSSSLEENRAEAHRSLTPDGAAVLVAEGATLAAATDLLGPDGMLLTYVWTGDSVWGLTVGPKDTPPSVQRLGDGHVLAGQLLQARIDLRDPTSSCDLAGLSKSLLFPFWDSIKRANSLLVVAEGPLAFLPIEALSAPDGRLLLECVAVANAPSLAALISTPQPRGTLGATVPLHLQAPIAHTSEPPSRKLARIQARASVSPHAPGPLTISDMEAGWSGESVDETLVNSLSEDGLLAEHRLVHFGLPAHLDGFAPSATCLLLSPEVPDSKLPLWRRADGVLDLREIRQLRFDADLLVLPGATLSPHAGLYLPEPAGLHALVRSLWSAGARGVLISDWAEDDPLARDFLESLLDRARLEPSATALREAQLAWIHSSEATSQSKHPYYWARLRYFGRPAR